MERSGAQGLKERVMPTGGQVEPSAQLRLSPLGITRSFRTGLSALGSTLINSNIYSIKGVLWALLSVPV